MNGQEYDNKGADNAQAKIQVLCTEKGDKIKTFHFSSIDSTNTWAKRHFDQWSKQGITLVVADEQTAGRGRNRRSWLSPSGVNLYLTFCFWIDLERQDMGHLAQLLALAIAQLLQSEGFFPTLKWPNDILLRGKKVGGVLCETFVDAHLRGIVCGAGLNVNMEAEALQVLNRPVTSLKIISGHHFDLDKLCKRLVEQFLQNLKQWQANGFAPCFAEYASLLGLQPGQSVRFHDQSQVLEAKFQQLFPDGSLQLRLADGSCRRFYAGEFLE